MQETLLDNIKEIAEYLDDKNIINDIKLMKKAIETNNFLLTFIGQFSSGKSKLINNIIGKNILPVHISESTQVVTFIKYSEEEYGNIVYEDLSVKQVKLNSIKEIWQGQNRDELNIKKINYIEVFLKSDFLKSGLIIADTPGVNTIIKEHEKITNEVLKSSEEIMYVISKPITNFDKRFINEILKNGLKVSCVRTFMDKIKVTEENPEESIENDIEEIKKIDKESDINVYHVSNEENNKWFNKINDIKSYITNNLSINVSNNIHESINFRITKIANDIKIELQAKKSELEKIVSGNIKEVEEQKKELDKAIKILEERLSRKKKNIDREILNVKDNAKKEIEEIKKIIIINVEKEIEKTSFSKNVDDILKKLLFKRLNESYSKLVASYIQPFNDIILEKSNEIKKELNILNISSILKTDELIPLGIEEVVATIDQDNIEIEKIKKGIMVCTEESKKIEEGIKENNIKKEKLESERKKYYDLANDIKKEISKHGEYQCKFIESEEQQIQPSQILKSIGNTLDWITCLLPEEAYIGIAEKIGKAWNMGEKAIKAYKNVDSIKDMAFALKNIEKTTKSSKIKTQNVMNTVSKAKEYSQQTGILDICTFQYWFEKIGSKFDKPLKMEIDKEYEKEYNTKKAILNEKYSHAKQIEMRKLQELGLIKDEEQKMKKIKEIEDRKNKELLEELKEKEAELRKKAINNAFDHLKEEYFNWFKDKIEELSYFVKEKSNEKLENILLNYDKKYTLKLVYEINELKEKNNKLLAQYNEKGINDIKKSILICEKYITYLEEIIYGAV